MGIGWPQLLIIALVILVLFGRGRIAEMMGDFGKGISSFKKGMSEEADEKSASKAQIDKARIEAPGKDVAPDSASQEAKASEQSDSSN